ncbi:hypothetical protein SLEP1_g54668 [Rubroshorea leprosula]|uniref:Uncharacterized protein n=1 Tax=Rubroshorea leprosula TaxID=152421 RepID=A0AAV5MDB3_9ROSI|nr:hypothetical protein SLEP1_g54668 [Rubroshorea leprosula]
MLLCLMSARPGFGSRAPHNHAANPRVLLLMLRREVISCFPNGHWGEWRLRLLLAC